MLIAEHRVVVDKHQQRRARLRDALVAGAAIRAHAAYYRDLRRLKRLATHARQQRLDIAVQRWNDQCDCWCAQGIVLQAITNRRYNTISVALDNGVAASFARALFI